MTDGHVTGAAHDRVEVDGREYPVGGATLDGAGVLGLADLDPSTTSLVRIDGGPPRRVDGGARVVGGDTPRFRSGANGVVWTLLVDGERWDWPQRTISVRDVVEIAGLPANAPLRLVGFAGPLPPDGDVDLTSGAARVTSAPPAEPVESVFRGAALPSTSPVTALPPSAAGRLPVVVNGRPFDVPAEGTTFENLVRLAFPQLPVTRGHSFTVTWRRGDLAHPQGSLAPRQTVRLAPGTIVDVASTVKG